MNLADFERSVKALIPSASVDMDNEGQIIIYTSLKMSDPRNHQSELVEFVLPPDSTDEDPYEDVL